MTSTVRLLGPPAPDCPIAPLPFDDHQWAALSAPERRRQAHQWYRVAQPVPRQRGWLPPHSKTSARNLWLRTQFACRLLGGLQHGKRATADLVHDLDAARAHAAALSGEVGDACTTVLELSALVLADRGYSTAPTKEIAVRNPRQGRAAS